MSFPLIRKNGLPCNFFMTVLSLCAVLETGVGGGGIDGSFFCGEHLWKRISSTCIHHPNPHDIKCSTIFDTRGLLPFTSSLVYPPPPADKPSTKRLLLEPPTSVTEGRDFFLFFSFRCSLSSSLAWQDLISLRMYLNKRPNHRDLLSGSRPKPRSVPNNGNR